MQKKNDFSWDLDIIQHGTAHYSKNWNKEDQRDYNKKYYQEHKDKWGVKDSISSLLSNLSEAANTLVSSIGEGLSNAQSFIESKLGIYSVESSGNGTIAREYTGNNSILSSNYDKSKSKDVSGSTKSKWKSVNSYKEEQENKSSVNKKISSTIDKIEKKVGITGESTTGSSNKSSKGTSKKSSKKKNTGLVIEQDRNGNSTYTLNGKRITEKELRKGYSYDVTDDNEDSPFYGTSYKVELKPNGDMYVGGNKMGNIYD